MRRLQKRLAAFLVICGLAVPNLPSVATEDSQATIAGSARDGQRWNFFVRENQIDRLWLELSAIPRSSEFAITGVNLIAMTGPEPERNMTVIVNDGLIVDIGPSDETPIPTGALQFDSRGKYLLPGLVDMHVHSLVTNSQPLLNLANGVTSVREMSGFFWMLGLRDRIANNMLLAPTMYLTGHILSGMPMEFYATVVGTPEAARQAVRDQVAAGFDFVKVHNIMSPDVLAAISDEAAALNIDVVGHVPHGMTVAEGISMNLRTLEHFKGYILDSSLTMSDEDFVTATENQEIWNTPTFTTYRAQLRGLEADEKILSSDQIRYVPPSDRIDWMALANTPSDRLNELRKNVYILSTQIFAELLTIDARFLAGTDSGGGIPFMIPGFVLHEELRIMEENGLTPYRALQTATINAATAMRRVEQFGTIEIGKRADLLLVAANPLDTVNNLSMIEGVAVRGIWLSRAELDQILTGIASVYRVAENEDLRELPTLAEVDALIEDLIALRLEGFVFRNFDLGELSRLLRKAGLDDRAATVRSLKAR